MVANKTLDEKSCPFSCLEIKSAAYHPRFIQSVRAKSTMHLCGTCNLCPAGFFKTGWSRQGNGRASFKVILDQRPGHCFFQIRGYLALALVQCVKSRKTAMTDDKYWYGGRWVTRLSSVFDCYFCPRA